MTTKEERLLINAIHEKALFDQIMPAIREAVKSGGGADAILKKSEPLAATRLVQSAASDDPAVSLKASIEILNRTQGKPVERSINVYGDISKMNERDVDAQIMSLLERTGAQKLVETTLDISAKPTRKRAQKRKPRKSDPLITIDVDPKPNGSN